MTLGPKYILKVVKVVILYISGFRFPYIYNNSDHNNNMSDNHTNYRF